MGRLLAGGDSVREKRPWKNICRMDLEEEDRSVTRIIVSFLYTEGQATEHRSHSPPSDVKRGIECQLRYKPPKIANSAQTDTCARTFTAAATMGEMWERPKRPSADECTDGSWPSSATQTKGGRAASKGRTPAPRWMNSKRGAQ